jgi:plastocyanin
MRSKRGRLWGALFGAAAMAALVVPAPVSADPITGESHPADIFAATGWRYVPETITIDAGDTIKFGNYDIPTGVPAHSLTELVEKCTGAPYTGNNPGQGTCRLGRFSSGLVDHGHVREVAGVEKLAPGTYAFVCQVHEFMRGWLIVR